MALQYSQLSRSGSIDFTMSADLLDEIRIADDEGRDILVRWRAVAGGVLIRLEISNDSWSLLASAPEVLAALSGFENTDATPEDIVLALRGIGMEEARAILPPGP